FVNEATANDAAYVGLPDIRGVKIESFSSEESPARKAGLEMGDIIVSIDGQPVEYTAQLQQVVGFRHPGETVKVEVARKGGVRKTCEVRLISAAASTEVSPAGHQAQPDDSHHGGRVQGSGVREA